MNGPRFLIKPLQRALLELGVEIRRHRPPGVGCDPFRDMRELSISENPVIFDVGANVGQTTFQFLETFKEPSIHAFEPGLAFAQLSTGTAPLKSVRINNFAIGAHDRTALFRDNAASVLSSFLPRGKDGWNSEETDREVEVRTIDSYAAEFGIEEIDILKSDTQGYELEVLRGASSMLARRAIRMVYVEIVLTELYVGLPGLDQIFALLIKHGFRLVSFYNFNYQNGGLGWMDALFVLCDG